MSALAKLIKVLIGLVLIVLGLASYTVWWPALLVLVKGALGLFVAGVGFLLILIAMTD